MAAGIGDGQGDFQREQRETTAHQVNAGRDHGGRVDQGADGGRAFHGVGQPDLQRKLGRLADAAEEDAEPGRDQHPVGNVAKAIGSGILLGQDGAARLRETTLPNLKVVTLLFLAAT